MVFKTNNMDINKEKVAWNFPLRILNKDAKNGIKKKAVKNGRSVNTEINRAIEYWLTDDFIPIDPPKSKQSIQ